ncbi:TIGR02808 family protein [Aliikangiella sp. G2MR2-5]|nr:TIGR02808 family protein [Aliikangiella sp. G2MR2-5]
MGGLETTIWYILGFLAMPVIFLTGFFLFSYTSIFILNLFGKNAE